MSHRVPWSARITGVAMGLGSAAITGILLFLNGGLVLAIVNALASGGLPLLGHESVSQFLVLMIPVCFVVIQWWMIDYVRTRLAPRRTVANLAVPSPHDRK